MFPDRTAGIDALTFVEPTRSSGEIPSAARWALASALVLAIGSTPSGPLLFLLGLPLILVSAAIGVGAVWRVGRPGAQSWLGLTSALLSVMTATTIMSSSTHGPFWFEAARRAFGALGLVLIGMFASDGPHWRRRAVNIAIMGAVTLALMAPLVVPHPDIDVWSWTQTAVRALVQGVHPYTVAAPDLSQGKFDFGYTLTIYPYMPSTLLIYAPWFALFGDFRFALAACLPATVLLVRAAGKRLSLDERLIDAATLAIALHPKGPLMVVSGWTEPLLVVVLAGFVYLAVRAPQGVGQATAFFLLPALKQYIVVPALMYLAMKPPRARPRAVLAGVSVAAATILPFCLWEWRPTLAGIVFQFAEQRIPRIDAYSVTAWLMAMTGAYPPKWVSVALQLTVGAIAYVRLRSYGLGGLLLGSAVALDATFLSGWQAYVNYYYLVGAFLVLAAMTLSAPPEPA